MRPLLVSTYDSFGGAAKAALRLHHGLRMTGVSSSVVAQDKRKTDSTVVSAATPLALLTAKLRPRLDALVTSICGGCRQGLFSPAVVPTQLGQFFKKPTHDVIHLHWVNEGFLRIEDLANCRKPVVWTLHDMWPFTGGCHHSGDCRRFCTQCCKCPHLGWSSKMDLSYWTWLRKNRSWKDVPFTIISPSNWLAQCARDSALFRRFPIEVIPNGIDTNCFAPHDKQLCRSLLGLPQDAVLLLAGGVAITKNDRKGIRQLIQALKLVVPGVEIAVLGAADGGLDLGMPTHYLGYLHDDMSLAVAYAAADIFVSASLEENLSNMVMEAAACGVPTVAFRVGGMSDLVDSGKNGLLVTLEDADEMAGAINRLVCDQAERVAFGAEARKIVEREFAMERVVQRYIQVYKRVIENNAENQQII